MVCWSVTRGGKHPRLAAGCVTHRHPVMQAEQLRGERVPRKKKATRFWGNTQGPGGGAQIPSALGGKGEVSRAGNGWESSPKAWQRGRFCRGGGGAFSFPPSPGKPRCLLPSGELHRSPQASGGHPQPLSSASSESSPRPRARGKGRAGWESTEGGARSHLPSVPGARCQPLRVSLPGDALLPAPTGWQQPPAAPAGHPRPRVGLPRAFFFRRRFAAGGRGEKKAARGAA